MDINQLIAAKIRELRMSRNLTLEAVAQDLGISKAAMSQLENGRVEITARKIALLAKIFHVSAAVFFEGNGIIETRSAFYVKNQIIKRRIFEYLQMGFFD